MRTAIMLLSLALCGTVSGIPWKDGGVYQIEGTIVRHSRIKGTGLILIRLKDHKGFPPAAAKLLADQLRVTRTVRHRSRLKLGEGEIFVVFSRKDLRAPRVGRRLSVRNFRFWGDERMVVPEYDAVTQTRN